MTVQIETPTNQEHAPNGSPKTFVFRRRHRLSHKHEFDAVYSEGIRKVNGPLAIYGRPNGLENARLGLAVGKRLGNAVRRSRMKRLLRESFRLLRADMPSGYDLVISVRPHRSLTLERYTLAVRECWKSIDREWVRRNRPQE